MKKATIVGYDPSSVDSTAIASMNLVIAEENQKLIQSIDWPNVGINVSTADKSMLDYAIALSKHSDMAAMAAAAMSPVSVYPGTSVAPTESALAKLAARLSVFDAPVFMKPRAFKPVRTARARARKLRLYWTRKLPVSRFELTWLAPKENRMIRQRGGNG